jgi:hypothetical protein
MTRGAPLRHFVSADQRLWVHQAACRDADPALFDADTTNLIAALTYCQLCPVRAECKADARQNHDVGVRGGELLGEQRPSTVDRRHRVAQLHMQGLTPPEIAARLRRQMHTVYDDLHALGLPTRSLRTAHGTHQSAHRCRAAGVWCGTCWQAEQDYQTDLIRSRVS